MHSGKHSTSQEHPKAACRRGNLTPEGMASVHNRRPTEIGGLAPYPRTTIAIVGALRYGVIGLMFFLMVFKSGFRKIAENIFYLPG